MAENVPQTGSAPVASAQPSSMRTQRLSFASVAAMAPPSTQTSAGQSASNKAEKPNLTSANRPSFGAEDAAVSGTVSPRLEDSISRLDIKDGQVPVPDVPEHELHAPLQLRPRLDDEKTHLSFSSTKPPSLDGKSVASATTFAMDEKESIRPDDSASVKAAEDDDSNSGPTSGAPNSRVGSEAGERAFGNQFNEISQRMGPGMFRSIHPMGRPVPNVAEELRRGQMAPPNIVNPVAPGMPRTDTTSLSGCTSPPFTLPAMPDEKILEAMFTPKDRIFLLSLEQQVISFIRDSNDPVLNLPPCNSFCRLLAHRLGDYYALGHVLDNSQSAVQLHRTPQCQLRPPLSSFETKTTPPNGVSALPSMKIMRRAEISGDNRPEGSGTNTTENSVGPSKAGSEADSENPKGSGLASPAESTSTKDKAASTREEREAKYKEARDRIFADWKENEGVEANQTEGGNDASRASSTSGKKKNKKKNNNDDSFDSRSTYNAYFPSNQRQAPVYEQSAPINYYYPYGQPNSGQVFSNGYQQTYGQQYPQMPQAPQIAQVPQVPQMPQMPLQPQMSQIPQGQNYQMPVQQQNQMQTAPGMYPPQTQQQYMQYGQQMPPNFYPQMQQPNQMLGPHQPPSMPSPASSNHSAQLSSRPQSQMSDQAWGQNAYQLPYQGYQSPQTQYAGQSQQMVPQANQNNASAVPYAFGQLPYQSNGQGSRPMHPIPGSYNRQNQYSNSPSRAPMDPSAFRSPSGGYHGSAMVSSYPPPQQPQFSPAQQLQPTFNSQHSSPRRPNINANAPRPQSPNHNTLAKWGTTTLPPKPPPPAPINPMAGSNAGGVPTFQNGMYSKPSNVSAENKVSVEPVSSQ